MPAPSSVLVALDRHPADHPWLILPHAPHSSDAHRVVSYGELQTATRRIAHGFHARGARPGDRVAVLADNTAEAATSMLGALRAGLVLVPVAPRSVAERRAAWGARFDQVCSRTQPRWLVGAKQALEEIEHSHLPLLAHEILIDSPATPYDAPGHSGSNPLQLIQFTSGTTTRARGVALHADHLTSNVQAMGQAIGVRPQDVTLCWIPLFHDMGLIGTLLFSAYWGLPMVLMTPRSVLARPESWLWSMSRFGVTCCAAPNSAYQLCASRCSAEKLNGLDLSAWRVACNGSELVQPATLQAFAARFSAYGFKAEAMSPVYGLAESTVAVTAPDPSRAAHIEHVERAVVERQGCAVLRGPDMSASRGIVSLGRPLPGHSLRIVRGASRADVEEGQVGRVLVSGPSVMAGYYGESDEQSPVRNGWLDTGDLGYLRAGELYLVGRHKDVIKRGGGLVDACEVASILADVPGIRGGRVAVFGVPDEDSGTERVVVMLELQPGASFIAVERMVRDRAFERLSLSLDQVVLARPGQIPRTTSGKTQHSKARTLLLQRAGHGGAP